MVTKITTDQIKEFLISTASSGDILQYDGVHWTNSAASGLGGSINGSGITNSIVKWSDSNTLGYGLLSDDGTTVSLTQTSTAADQNMVKISPYAAHPQWIPLKFSTGHADFGDFNFSCNSGVFDAGVRDPYMFWGYNVLPDGTAQNKTNGQAAMYYGIEGYYAVSPTNHVSETYIQYSPNDGSAGLRPLTVGVYHETKTSNVNISTNNFIINNDAGTNKWQVSPALGWWTCQSGTSFRLEGNSQCYFWQKNAAGDAWIPLIYADSANRITIGSDYIPILWDVQVVASTILQGLNHTSGNECYSLNLTHTNFGNYVDWAHSVIWGYSNAYATIMGKMEGHVVTGGMDIRFHTYGSSALTERFRITGGNSATGVLLNHVGELTAAHGVVFDNKLTVDHVGETTGAHKIVFDNSPSITTAYIDHIAEATGSHNIVFDNKITADHIGETTGAHNVIVDNILVAESTKRVACGGGSTGAGTTPNGTVTLEINGTSYYLLTSASA